MMGREGAGATGAALRRRVLVSSPFFGRYSPDAVSRVEAAACELQRLAPELTRAELSRAVSSADAWIVGLQTVSRDLLEGAPSLKAICVHGVGVDRVDVQAATERGVLVTNTPGTNATAVAELTIGLMIALGRDLSGANRLVKDGGWEFLVGEELLNGLLFRLHFSAEL